MTKRAKTGYLLDWEKIKSLCRQCGMKISDLYEPGVFPVAVVSYAAIKKWRAGGRISIDSLLKLSHAFSKKLHWHVELLDLVRAEPIEATPTLRLAVLPLQNVSAGPHHDFADGFRATIVAILSKLGVQVMMVPPGSNQSAVALKADVALNAVLHGYGEQLRLDIQLTDTKSHDILWAATYRFDVAEVLSAQIAIAANIAEGVRKPLAAA